MDTEDVKENTFEIIQHALTQELNFSIEGLAPLPSEDMGDVSSVFTGVHDGQKVIIKLGRTGESFQTEAAILDLMQQHGIPCPKVVRVLETLHRVERPVIVETRSEGASLKHLKEEENLPRLLEQTGKILKTIHNIPLDGFGELKIENEKLVGSRSSWQEYMETYEPRIQYVLENGFINQDEDRRIREILQEIMESDIPQGFFLHGDVHEMHIFTDGKDVTGIIDPGYALSGDPRWDVAYAHFFLTPQERIHFNDGYGDGVHDPVVSAYMLMIAVDKIKYRHAGGFIHRMPQAINTLKDLLR